MSLSARSLVMLLVSGLVICACASDVPAVASPQTAAVDPPRQQVSRFRIGKPYNVAGRVYRPQSDWDYDEEGVASWYGGRFHGRRTASGEVFDKYQLTAAHPTLPLPVIAKITNLENGRSVKVRINDRGPFAHDRLIDVSRAAAEQLGFIDQGTARVRVQVMSEESHALLEGTDREELPAATRVALQMQTAVPVRERSAVYLQVASFSERSNAEALRRELAGIGKVEVKPATVSGKQFYRVRMGPFANASAALNLRERLAEAGTFRPHLVFDRGAESN